MHRFSPASGIQVLATNICLRAHFVNSMFQSRKRDSGFGDAEFVLLCLECLTPVSVPQAGFRFWRPGVDTLTGGAGKEFQSRKRDSGFGDI